MFPESMDRSCKFNSYLRNILKSILIHQLQSNTPWMNNNKTCDLLRNRQPRSSSCDPLRNRKHRSIPCYRLRNHTIFTHFWRNQLSAQQPHYCQCIVSTRVLNGTVPVLFLIITSVVFQSDNQFTVGGQNI